MIKIFGGLFGVLENTLIAAANRISLGKTHLWKRNNGYVFKGTAILMEKIYRRKLISE
jgi:hypothetical protein